MQFLDLPNEIIEEIINYLEQKTYIQLLELTDGFTPFFPIIYYATMQRSE